MGRAQKVFSKGWVSSVRITSARREAYSRLVWRSRVGIASDRWGLKMGWSGDQGRVCQNPHYLLYYSARCGGLLRPVLHSPPT